jgi:hypothetical protein
MSSLSLVRVRLAAFMEFPITIPPRGMRYRAVGGTICKRRSIPRVATAATPTAPAATTNALGTSFALRADVHPANATIPARSSATAPRLSSPKM